MSDAKDGDLEDPMDFYAYIERMPATWADAVVDGRYGRDPTRPDDGQYMGGYLFGRFEREIMIASLHRRLEEEEKSGASGEDCRSARVLLTIEPHTFWPDIDERPLKIYFW